MKRIPLKAKHRKPLVSLVITPRSNVRGLQNEIVWRPIQELKPRAGHARLHPQEQVARLSKSIQHLWTNPIVIDEDGVILFGHARHQAAQRNGMIKVPTLICAGLTEAEKIAVTIADNKLAELGTDDLGALRIQLKKLSIDVQFDMELTGLSTGEIDLIMDGHLDGTSADPADAPPEIAKAQIAISRLGDIWHLGRHRIICADALAPTSYSALLVGELAQMVVADVPFNVRIHGHAMGRGKVHHREFVQASGEMSDAEYDDFLTRFIVCVIEFSGDGAISYIFSDWKHVHQVINAALSLYSEYKNLLVWNKTNGGQGSFYRSKHELIAVFKNGTDRHINNFSLGKLRYRTNVIDYPGVNSFHPARAGDLQLHPTVKPVALIADLIRDCSRRNGVILDPFGGSGTTILAAERTGRVARLIELDPLYVDVAIRRWEKVTGIQARHASGPTFAEIATTRATALCAADRTQKASKPSRQKDKRHGQQ